MYDMICHFKYPAACHGGQIPFPLCMACTQEQHPMMIQLHVAVSVLPAARYLKVTTNYMCRQATSFDVLNNVRILWTWYV